MDQQYTTEDFSEAHLATIDLALAGIETVKAVVRGGASQATILEALVCFGAQLEETRSMVNQ